MFKIISTKEYDKLKKENELLNERLTSINSVYSVNPQDFAGFINAFTNEIIDISTSNITVTTGAKISFFEKLVKRFLLSHPAHGRPYLINKFLEVIRANMPVEHGKKVR